LPYRAIREFGGTVGGGSSGLRLPQYHWTRGWLCGTTPFFGWLESVAVTLVVSCLMLGYAVFRPGTRKWIALILVTAYVSASAGLFCCWNAVRDNGRWSILVPGFKADLAEHAMRTSGSLRHYELDSWGFPGAGDTYVYAVYDPSDSLVATDVKGAAFIPQLRCDVVSIKRKERSWFAVMFYTMTTWDECPPKP
jgi:hypothetical protein